MEELRIKSAAQRLIHWITETDEGTASMDAFDWFQGVALFGLYQYAKLYKDQHIMRYLLDWFDGWLRRGLPGKNINSMCPMLTLSWLYTETKREDYLKCCEDWLSYAMNELPRTEEGGFQHVTIDSSNTQQLWDDSLYMTVLFVARMGTLLERDDCLQESIRQFLLHVQYLTDVKTGLFFHGWTFLGRHHFGGALWGRGNAWYTAGLAEYLEMAALPRGVRDFLIGTLKRQVAALQQLQAENGMFHTLLDDSDSYQETSATAGFGYGILKAVRLGYLDASCRSVGQKALEAVLARIDDTGVVQQVSGGTCVGSTRDYYKSIPIEPRPYGQSMALLLLMEGLNSL